MQVLYTVLVLVKKARRFMVSAGFFIAANCYICKTKLYAMAKTSKAKPATYKVGRNAETGKFMKVSAAQKNKKGAVVETIKKKK
jgi:hypothetical protein